MPKSATLGSSRPAASGVTSRRAPVTTDPATATATGPTPPSTSALTISAAPETTATRRRTLGPPPRWVGLALILGVWQVASATGVLPADKLAAPSQIAVSAWELIVDGQLAQAIGVSLGRVFTGLALGLVAGGILGLVCGLSRWGDALLDPPLQALRTLPHLGLVPLFILWFGIGDLPKVLLIALGVAFPIYLNLHSAVRGVDRGLLEVARVNHLGRTATLRHVVFPSALPQVLVGLRQSLAIAWLSLIVAEQVNADAGLGFLINNARDFLQTDVVVVGLVVYALLGLGSDAIVRFIEHRALAWRAGSVLR